MKKRTAAFGLLVLLWACQKEAELQDPATVTQSNSSQQLKRYVEVEGADSVSVDFTYDAAGRITKMYLTETGLADGEIRMYRNAAGLLTRYVFADDVANPSADSMVYTLASNAANGQYRYALLPFDVSGFTYVDSTVFAYDASGNITQLTSYSRLNLPAAPYSPYVRHDYTYQGKNVLSEKVYENLSSGWTLSNTDTYAYDSKTNPFSLGAEAILLQINFWAGTNNITSHQSVAAGTPPSTTTSAFTYTYHPFDKPASGTEVETPGGSTTHLRYYYK